MHQFPFEKCGTYRGLEMQEAIIPSKLMVVSENRLSVIVSGVIGFERWT